MGLFTKMKKKQEDEIAALGKNVVEIIKPELVREYPIGEMMRRVATTKSGWDNKNTLFCTKDPLEITPLMGTLMQSVALGHSIVIVDVDEILYTEIKPLLVNNSYHIKFFDIENENSSTWSVFDDMSDKSAMLYKSQQIIDVIKWDILPREKAVNKDYTDGLSVTLAAVLSYIIQSKLLSPNKFEEAYQFLRKNTVKNLDTWFNAAADTPKSLWFDFRDEHIEEYVNDLFKIFDILRDDMRNRLINDDDLNMKRPSIRKTAYILNFMGDVDEKIRKEVIKDNIPLNLILNFSLNTFIMTQQYFRENPVDGNRPLPIDFFIVNLDVHPSLHQFIYTMSHEAKPLDINMFATCVDIAYMYDTYYMVSEEIVDCLQYIVLSNNDKENKNAIKDMLQFEGEIPDVDVKNDQEVIICQQQVIKCSKYNIENHTLYDETHWD